MKNKNKGLHFMFTALAVLTKVVLPARNNAEDIISSDVIYLSFSHVIFEFRNLATKLFNSLEKFLEIPGALV